MSGFTKQRDEQDSFEMSFVARLGTGETLSAPEVVVSRAVLFRFADVTTEVLDVVSVVAVNGIVQFMLVGAASVGVQLSGTHQLHVKVTTSLGRTLVGTAALHITE